VTAAFRAVILDSPRERQTHEQENDLATEEPARTAAPTITSLPRLEDLRTVEQGYETDAVRDAFDSYRRHVVQLQAQLRVLKAAGRTADVEPTGHAMRMDALHLIREAAEFADVLERDAQRASAAQLRRTEAEIRRRQQELQQSEADVERFRQESERLRAETLNAARNEARQLLADANREANQEVREAEARAARLLEQARHQATELTNATRAEVEQTLEWSRGQAATIMSRAQQGAEQLLAAAGLGEPAVSRVVEALIAQFERESDAGTTPTQSMPPHLRPAE
jgi:F0F1-type ATP synthase membrane subunit b/b'